MKVAKSSIAAMALAGLLLAAALGLALVAWNLLHTQTPPLRPSLASDWHNQTFGLDDDEVVRFVPPPYSPQRMKDFGRGWGGSPPKHILHSGMPSGVGNLTSGIALSTGQSANDRDIPPELGALPADGDWMAFMDAPIDARMKALESILSAVTGRNLLVEKRFPQRDVIVARGTYAFHEDETYAALAARAQIEKPRRGVVHFYTLPLSRILGGGGGSGEFSELLKRIEECSWRHVIDQAQQPHPKSVQWSNNYSQLAGLKDEAKLDQLLMIVGKQTSLQFTKERRPMPIWFVRERNATTQPAGAQ